MQLPNTPPASKSPSADKYLPTLQKTGLEISGCAKTAARGDQEGAEPVTVGMFSQDSSRLGSQPTPPPSVGSLELRPCFVQSAGGLMLCWCLTSPMKITPWQWESTGRPECGSHSNWSNWFGCFSGFPATLSRRLQPTYALISDQPSLVKHRFRMCSFLPCVV